MVDHETGFHTGRAATRQTVLGIIKWIGVLWGILVLRTECGS